MYLNVYNIETVYCTVQCSLAQVYVHIEKLSLVLQWCQIGQ